MDGGLFITITLSNIYNLTQIKIVEKRLGVIRKSENNKNPLYLKVL